MAMKIKNGQVLNRLLPDRRSFLIEAEAGRRLPPGLTRSVSEYITGANLKKAPCIGAERLIIIIPQNGNISKLK